MPDVERLFTIALPVRNGGEHIKDCIASILAQKYCGFDLVVLENASTDGTAEWLKTITDERVSVIPAPEPLTIEANWGRILDIPKNEYITTIGHDDLLDPDFLDVILRLIADHPDAGLYLTHFRLVDTHGRFIRHCFPMPEREAASEFLAARLCGLRHSYGTGHVLRSDEYDALGGIPPYPKLLAADDAFFLMAVRGSYRATAIEEAFSYRYHSGSESGGAEGQALFTALEPYADFLLQEQKSDPAIAEVLTRHFGNFARPIGLRWLREAVLSPAKHDDTALIEIEHRISRLAELFGESAVGMDRRRFRERILARAPHSSVSRTLYRLLERASSYGGRLMR